MKAISRIRALLVPILFLPAAAAAQAVAPATDREVIDRVVAIAGDSAVLESEIKEDMLRILATQGSLPDEPEALAELRRDLIQERLDQLLLLQAAARDSVQVESSEVDRAVEQEITQRRRAFDSEAAFEAALLEQGMTLEEYRGMLREQLARDLLIRRYLARVQQERQPPTITENEIRAYFEERRDRLGERPATVTFRQVVIAPEPADSALEAARAEAERLMAEIRGGADFAELARRHSDDPATRERGGDLGWFRQGQMLPEFERAAFSLPPGAVSGPVESSAGIHLIKVEKVRGPERQARHILIRPATSPADANRARTLADSVASALRAGAAIDSLVERFGDPSEQSRVGPYPIDQLPPPYDQALRDATAGAIVGPLQLDDPQEPKWAVVRVTGVQPAGPYTLEDVRDRIKQQLQQQKLFEEILAELRRRSYVDIRA